MLPWVFNVSPTLPVVRNELAEFSLINRVESLRMEPILENFASAALVTMQTELEKVANHSQIFYDVALNNYFLRVSAWEKHIDLTNTLHSYYKDLSIPDQVFIECYNGLLGQTRNVTYNFIYNKLYSVFDPFGIHCTPRNILFQLDFMINEIELNGGSSPLVLEYLNCLYFPWGPFF